MSSDKPSPIAPRQDTGEDTDSRHPAAIAGGELSALQPPQAVGECSNCNAPLYGPYCHQCGQNQRSILRYIGHLALEVADEVFGFDARAWRTLWPLMLKPGYLTNEYIAGRRNSYVPPVRLYLIISVLTFFTLHLLSSDWLDMENPQLTVKEVSDSVRAEDGEAARVEDPDKELVDSRLASVEERDDLPEPVRKQVAEARAAIESSRSEEPRAPDLNVSFNTSDGEYLTIPILPEAANKLLEERQKYWSDRFNAANELRETDPAGAWSQQLALIRELAENLFDILPTLMFLLLPVFALILKVLYPLSRRYYMEHMILALHSHSFIFLTLLVVFVLNASTEWIGDAWPAFATGYIPVIGVFATLLLWWIPIYLYITQLRVYRQGWFVTFCKFCLTGLLYMVLLLFGFLLAMLLSITFG